MPRLVIIRGPDQGKVYELTADMITIGRGRKNEIIIRDNEVSREHCRLVRVLNQYEIHDLGSSNGTYVNGHPVNEGGYLADAPCIIELGDSVTLEYYPDDTQADLPPVLPSTQELTRHDFYLLVKMVNEPKPSVYPLENPTIGIGRGLDNDIVIQAAEMSRQHMRLILSKAGYVIEDLKSMNGTFINGERVNEPRLLHLNDVITVGTALEIQYTGKPAEDAAEPLTRPMKLMDDAHQTRPTNTRRLKANAESTTTNESGHGLKPGSLDGHVFIAYAQEDWQPIVGKMFAHLQDHDVPVWADQYLQYGSKSWQEAITQALTEAAALVIVVSPRSMNRDHVRRSLQHFLNREKPVILFHYQDVPQLPISAQKLPAIWFNPALPEEGLRKLAAEIQRLREG